MPSIFPSAISRPDEAPKAAPTDKHDDRCFFLSLSLLLPTVVQIHLIMNADTLSTSGPSPSTPFETVIVLWPVEQSVVDSLASSFKDVIYRPSQGPATGQPLPTAQEWLLADAVFSFTIPAGLTKEQVPRLKLWQGCSAGYSHIEEHSFFRSLTPADGISFANASGIHVSTIGEHCLATVLMLYHRLHTIAIRTHVEQEWISPQSIGGNFIRELNTLTIGIVGYGHIGRETARLFHACGATVNALTRSGRPSPIHGYLIPHTGDPLGTIPSKYYASTSAETRAAFFGSCDVVINTLPDSERTRKCMGIDEFSAMKGDAVYVNIGRGTTTDQDKLVEALQAKSAEGEAEDAVGTLRIGAASLDVTDPEPLSPGHALFKLPNVILTPHMSGSSKTYFHKAVDVLLVNVERMGRGKGAVNGWFGKAEHA